MAVSDDKKNRLSSLSQDVIAISRAGDAEPPTVAPAPERAAPPPPSMPSGQDMFSSPANPAVDRRPATPAPQPVVRQPAGNGPLVWVFGTVAVIALALAVIGRGGDAGPSVELAANAEVMDKLAAELRASNERVAALEAKLSGAAADAATTDAAAAGPQAQGAMIQMGVAIRSLRDDVDKLSNQVGKLSAQVGEVQASTAAAGGNREIKVALAKAEQSAARAVTLAEQAVAAAQRAPAPAPAPAPVAPKSGVDEAQVKALAQKTDKMANDIRQLYRLLESN